MQPITPYTGIKLYQTTYTLFRCQYVCVCKPSSYFPTCNALLGVKIYKEAFALFGSEDLPGNICLIWNQDVPSSKRFIRCKDLPGNICLIRLSRYTRQHLPNSKYSGVKIYKATFALFGCQDITGNICLIRVSRYTRQHSPYLGVKIYQAAFALFRCQDIPGSIRLI